MIITIPGELCDLNKYIDDQRTHYHVGNKTKQRETKRCELAFWEHRLALKRLKLPLNFRFTFFCKNRRKDKDNIDFAKKFIFDGMINAGIIRTEPVY